jgi:hypothetical protein
MYLYEDEHAIFCRDRQVSWVRRKHGEDDLQLLTVGLHTYSGDSRYTVEFQYPNNWRLQIKFTNKRDEGTYECQISTHPPKVIQIHLHINGEQHGENAVQKCVCWLLSVVCCSCIQYSLHQWSSGSFDKDLRLINGKPTETKEILYHHKSLNLKCEVYFYYYLVLHVPILQVISGPYC